MLLSIIKKYQHTVLFLLSNIFIWYWIVSIIKVSFAMINGLSFPHGAFHQSSTLWDNFNERAFHHFFFSYWRVDFRTAGIPKVQKVQKVSSMLLKSLGYFFPSFGTTVYWAYFVKLSIFTFFNCRGNTNKKNMSRKRVAVVIIVIIITNINGIKTINCFLYLFLLSSSALLVLSS